MTTTREAAALLARCERFHLVGIEGAGMSALAEILRDRGRTVTGCDARPGPVVERLEALGVRVARGHDPDHLDPSDVVVVSSAVPATSPELVRARERGQPVVRRAELLGGLMAAARGIAIAGTHGKSTTTAMTGAVLAAGGLDPTVVVGGRIRGREGNVRIGRGEWLVAEADEFDRSFLALDPEHAVVTNVEADHLDTYATMDGVRAAFAAFVARTAEGGTVALGIDDPEARRLEIPAGRRVVTFGIGAGASVRAEGIAGEGTGTRFRLVADGAELGTVRLAMPGRHNVRNALAAAAVGRAVGVPPEAIVAGLGEVRGVGRRFEILHDGDVTVVDDYAHHPTEVAATLAAARGAWPDRRLVAVFQPHLYTRTRDFADAFGEALAAADLAFVTEVYPAREAPIEGVSGALVVEAARAAGADATFLPGPSSESDAVAGRLAPGDVVVTLGAGDVGRLARELVTELGRRDRAAAGAREGDR